MLYEEYIDWRKLREQKKPVDYIVPPATKVGRINWKLYGTKNILLWSTSFNFSLCSKILIQLYRDTYSECRGCSSKNDTKL